MSQVFQHGPQAARDLYALAAELSDFGDGKLNEVFPVRGSIGKSKPACCVAYLLVVQTPAAYVPEEMVNLAADRAGNHDLIVGMNQKLEVLIKAEIGIDDGREMPDIPSIEWTIDRVDM